MKKTVMYQYGDILRLPSGQLVRFINRNVNVKYITIQKRGVNYFGFSTMDRFITHNKTILDHNITNMTDKYRKYFSAIIIQRQWHLSINDPKYYLCQRRLMREFEKDPKI